MAQEGELQALREELQKIQDQTRRSRKRAAVGFVILVLVVVLSIGYAFIQQVAAERNAEEANRQRQLAAASEKMAVMAAEEARKQQGIAKATMQLAEERMQELEKCCKKR